MLNRLFISETLPRDLSNFGATLSEGLGSYKLYSYAFLSIGTILLILGIVKFRSPLVYVFAIGLLLGGIFFRYQINKTVKTRDLCFHKGKAIQAEVKGHHRKTYFLDASSFLSLKKQYVIQVEFIDGNGETRKKDLHHKDDLIWKTNPIGSRVVGLVHKDKSFFGEEMGATFHFFKN